MRTRCKGFISSYLVSILFLFIGTFSAFADSYSAYLFAYFKGEGLAQGEQIYFAVSRDGLHWRDLNDGRPVLTSTMGEKGLRDPFIMRSAEGDRFFVIATDLKIYGNGDWTAAQTNGSKSIMVWESTDLINWSEQRMCQVAPEGAGCTWAPETVYDEESGQYLVFWSSKIPASRNVANNDNTHRVYYCTTKDFKSFSSPKVWIELKNGSGRTISVIDATAIRVGNTYYRFKKNEATEAHKYGMPNSGKYIIMEKSSSLIGNWTEVDSDMSKVSGVEGPTCFKFNNEEKWCLLLDDFGGKGYYPLVTSDLSSGRFEQVPSGQYEFPSVMRHGSVVNITEQEYVNLLGRYDPDFMSVARINPAMRQQTIEGWGVSLCWWASMCGKWTDEKVDFLVDLLTSPDKLNFSIFRYNIGGGDDPSHRNGHMCNGKGKRAEMDGFKASQNAAYDWNADAGQRKVMLKIKEVRPDAIFEAFSNSPPYWMTYSGCASGNNPATADNLMPEYYGAFCDYLIDVCKHYKDTYGIEFKTLDPFNEPNTNYWGANGGQEGCHFSPSTQIDLIRVLYPKLQKSGMKTVISACDETSVQTAIGELQQYQKAGDIIPMLGQFNVHTYGGNRLDKANLRDLVHEVGLPFWMSESGAGGTGIAGNLAMAQRMFDDLNYLMPQAWIDWQFVEEANDQWCFVRGDFARQTYSVVKNCYVRMQVTRFIKPGYTLLMTGRDDLLVAESPDGKELVVVMLNTSTEEKNLSIELSLLRGVDKSAQLYVTNDKLNCERQTDLSVENSVLNYTMGGQEIATVILQKSVSDGVSPLTEGVAYQLVPRGAAQVLQGDASAVGIESMHLADESQLWYFKKVEKDKYLIYRKQGEQMLALHNDGSYFLTVAPMKENETRQQFQIESVGDNCFRIISVYDSKMLDLEGGGTATGTKVGLWKTDVTGANAHREWRILSAPFSSSPVEEDVKVHDPCVDGYVSAYGGDGFIRLFIDINSRCDVRVCDMAGRVVHTLSNLQPDVVDIPVSSGVYVIDYRSNVQSGAIKVMVR